MRHFGLFTFIVFAALQPVAAQYDTYSVNEPQEINAADSGKIELRFNSLSYFRNHEYFNQIWDGYTLFGNQFNPQLSFSPNARMRVEGGIWIDQTFGKEKLELQPTFSVKWKTANHKNTFLFGNIAGNINHGFVDAIYDYERLIAYRNEYGVQWLHNSKNLSHDLFINWEKYIARGDSTQEEFTAGYSGKIHLLNKERWIIDVPLQGYLNHNGGQINITSKNLTTFANAATGLSVKKKNTPNAFVKETRAEVYYVTYTDLSPNPGQLYKNGDALMGNLLFKSKHHVDLMLTYWSGTDFYSSKGNPLYQNYSAIGESYSQKQRDLLFVRLLWDKKLFDNFYAHFRLEPYYDMEASLFEYSYSLFLTYRQNFLLRGKVK
jgi:hypothetical protein